MKKIIEWVIHLLGGYTKSEYRQIEKRHRKFLSESKDNQNVQMCNEVTYRNLTILEEFAKKLYGEDPSDWCEKMYNVISNNRLRLIALHLTRDSSHIIFKINPYLDNAEYMDAYKKDSAKSLNFQPDEILQP